MLCYFVPVAGAILADSYLGRFRYNAGGCYHIYLQRLEKVNDLGDFFFSRSFETKWSAREITSVELSVERERHTDNAFQIIRRCETLWRAREIASMALWRSKRDTLRVCFTLVPRVYAKEYKRQRVETYN